MSERDRLMLSLQNLFGGRYGQGTYGNVLMEGARTPGELQLAAILGLYADRRVVFIPDLPGPLTWANTCQRVQRYEFPADAAAQQQTQAVLRPGGRPPAGLDNMLWMMASSRTAQHGLPLGFFTFEHLVKGGAEKVTFSYARMAPGPWLLEQFKRYAH